MGIAARIDAGHDVPQEVFILHQELHRRLGPLEAVVVLTNPVVLRLEAVEAYGYRVHARRKKAFEPLRREQIAIGHHAPRKLTAVEFKPHLLDIGAHQSLAACEDDESVVRIDMRHDVVHRLEEVGSGHVGFERVLLAVAAAMTAVHIAPQRTLPKQGTQRMQLCVVVSHLPL